MYVFSTHAHPDLRFLEDCIQESTYSFSLVIDYYFPW